MRIGLIADVHANLPALRAVLALLRREGVDRILCAGDLVGYGPHPNECVEVVAEEGAACVAGNHDLIVLGELTPDRCIPLARESLEWTRRVLREDVRHRLADLPRQLEVGTLLVAHGSIDDPQEYVTRPEQAREQLELLARDYAGEVLALGHTHRPWLCGSDGEGTPPPRSTAVPIPTRALLNPGSVGQSRGREVTASCMVLDTALRQVTWHAIPYDYEECRRALRRAGRPANSCHLYPSLLRRCAGRAWRVARRAASAFRP